MTSNHYKFNLQIQKVNILAQRARLWITPERGCTTSARTLQVKIDVFANWKVLSILRPKHPKRMKRSWSRQPVAVRK